MSADQLIAHALDLFAPLGPGVTARKMFGGLGFYSAGLFFAVGDVEEGALYLKVDEVSRPAFEAAGGRPFTYPMKDGRLMEMGYFTPPDEAMEDPEAMLPWARLGLEAAARKAQGRKPASKAARQAPGRKPASKAARKPAPSPRKPARTTGKRRAAPRRRG